MLHHTQLSWLALAVLPPLSWARSQDVYSPPILYPNATTVWEIGKNYTVLWNTSNPPAQITNPNGALYFVRNSLILLDAPLASGFSILAGQVGVYVQTNVTPGEYQLDLFGDSGNWSPPFEVKECE